MIALDRFPRWVLLIPFLALIASSTGCAAGKGDLTGKVTFNGKPVTSGTVQAFLPDGTNKTSDIAPDGSYKLLDLPAGTVKLGVSSPNPKKRYEELLGFAKTEEQRKAVPQPDPALVKSWVALPDSFESPDSSGLSATVNKGENTQDLVLTGTSSGGQPTGPVLPSRGSVRP
jgi:hypothetical protein